MEGEKAKWAVGIPQSIPLITENGPGPFASAFAKFYFKATSQLSVSQAGGLGFASYLPLKTNGHVADYWLAAD